MNNPQQRPSHLLIGLGGTGGRILRAFRKGVTQYRGGPDLDGVDYLYADTNPEFMGDDNQTWSVLGKNVQLPPSSRLHIKASDPAQVLARIDGYPGIAPWIGDRERFKNMISGGDTMKVFGGQKRRLGRFLFAFSVDEFRNRVDAIVHRLRINNSANITFHVIAGLAGGTGSGSIVDAVCQIRSMFPDDNCRILLYLLLPEQRPDPDWKKDGYHANGYAALLELNALEVGAYKPFDVSGQKGRLSLSTPYNLCYLFTDQNEGGLVVDIKETLPDTVASFLFQKIVNTSEVAWPEGDPLAKEENFENRVGEGLKRESAPVSGIELRTRRFFSFGTKQISYPEEEIKEYLTYSLASQAAQQLRFDNFSPTVGYVAEPKNSDYEWVRKQETETRWLITDEALSLSVGILPEELNDQWRPIADTWNRFKNGAIDSVRRDTAVAKEHKLTNLEQKFEHYYTELYRRSGVETFYRRKREHHSLEAHRKQIRKTIEAELFAGLLDGNRSIAEINAVVAALLRSLEEKKTALEQKLVESERRRATYEGEKNDKLAEWNRITSIQTLFGLRNRRLQTFAGLLGQLYETKTRIIGLQFAGALVDTLIGEIQSLASLVAAAETTIRKASEGVDRAMAVRIGDSGRANVDARVVRFYDPEAVKTFARESQLDEEQQKTRNKVVRNAIELRLGQQIDFTGFVQRLDVETFSDILVLTSKENLEQSGADAGSKDIFGVHVLERLSKHFAEDIQGLQAYIKSVAERAQTQVVFDDNQAKIRIEGAPSSERSQKRIIIVPAEAKDGNKAFRQQVVEAFRRLYTTATIGDHPTRVNEISIINIASIFPARFVRDVKFLKDEYQRLIGRDSSKQAIYELHTENYTQEWPDLFPFEADKEQSLPYLLLGEALGFVQTIEKPDTGASDLCLVWANSAGFQETLPLGSTLYDSADRIAEGPFLQLKTLVGQQLQSNGKVGTTAEKRNHIYEDVVTAVKEKLANAKPRSAEYETYKEAVKNVAQVLGVSEK